MGKKVKQVTKKTDVSKPEKKATEEAPEADSATVAQKKANDLKIKKQLKAMNANVLAKVDLKQVVSAVKALQAFAKKQSEDVAAKALLTDEDQTVHVTFTMTQVPTNPSPKPQMIKIDNPFVTQE